MSGETPLAIDTSVAIPFLVETHPDHVSVVAAVGERAVSLCGHALVETYSVLTRLPGDLAVDPPTAVLVIDSAFGPPLLIEGTAAQTVHRQLAEAEIAGGATYDGLVALAARAHGAVLLTRDARARATYEAVGIPVELVGAAPSSA